MSSALTKVHFCPTTSAQRPGLVFAKLITAIATALFLTVACYLAWMARVPQLCLIVIPFCWIFNSMLQRAFNEFLSSRQKAFLLPGGIVFPPGTIFSLRGRRWRTWQELDVAKLTWSGKEQFPSSDGLRLQYRDGSTANFYFGTMTKQDIERLLIAVEVWGPKGKRIGEFEELREYLSTNLIAGGHTSYTSIWNADLQRRFSLTTFNPLAPGMRLNSGRFEIVNQMSFGGFAAVYYALNTSGTGVVIKEIAIDQLKDQETRDAVLSHTKREVALLSSIQHPQIVKLLDSFVENGKYYLVLERIVGNTLRQMVEEKGPLDEPTVLSLAFGMLEILDYLHGANPPIIHRDFTPENLIFKNNKQVVLIDFNAANQYLSSATGTVIGKHAYMPPEQIRGKPEPCSDYFAMGMTLYFLLAGTDPEPLKRVTFPEIKLISLDFQKLILDLTEQERENRLDNIDAMKARLDAIATRVAPGSRQSHVPRIGGR
jgi:tRNA A-37 threonylcarbamoyl transferase component Bud32